MAAGLLLSGCVCMGRSGIENRSPPGPAGDQIGTGANSRREASPSQSGWFNLVVQYVGQRREEAAWGGNGLLATVLLAAVRERRREARDLNLLISAIEDQGDATLKARIAKRSARTTRLHRRYVRRTA